MRLILLAGALTAMAAPAGASTLVLGGSLAEACFNNALAGDASAAALTECDRALIETALTRSDRVSTLVNRGALRLIRNNYPAAMADFNAALALDPHHADALVNRGLTLLRLGEPRDAIRDINEGLARNPSRPHFAHFNRAAAYEALGDAPSAYADYTRAAELAPEWPAPRQELERFSVQREGA